MNQPVKQIYDETAATIEAAFLGFERVYSVQHPKPEYNAQNRGVFGAKHIGLAAALIGSIIVSASHTIPVFLGIASITDVQFDTSLAIALAAFVMVEIGIITFAYSATESAIHKDELHRVRAFTNAGKWFIAFIMLIANIYYVLQSNNVIPADIGGMWHGVRIVIYLAIGASAPVVAFITGDILAIDVLKHRSRQKTAQELYEQQMVEWREGLNEAWGKAKGKWGANVDIQVSKPVEIQNRHILSVSTHTDIQTEPTIQTAQSGYGYTRISNAVERALEWYTANPDSLDVPVRKLEQTIGVGKDSINKARAIYKQTVAK
jgi:hypothetical protein